MLSAILAYAFMELQKVLRDMAMVIEDFVRILWDSSRISRGCGSTTTSRLLRQCFERPLLRAFHSKKTTINNTLYFL